MVKGKGADSSFLKLNLTDPCRMAYSTVRILYCTVGRQAGSTVSVYVESPKQGSKRFNSNAKTKYIADLGIIYLWSK